MVRFIVSLALLVLLGANLQGALSSDSRVQAEKSMSYLSDPSEPIFPAPPPPPPPRATA